MIFASFLLRLFYLQYLFCAELELITIYKAIWFCVAEEQKPEAHTWYTTHDEVGQTVHRRIGTKKTFEMDHVPTKENFKGNTRRRQREKEKPTEFFNFPIFFFDRYILATKQRETRLPWSSHIMSTCVYGTRIRSTACNICFVHTKGDILSQPKRYWRIVRTMIVNKKLFTSQRLSQLKSAKKKHQTKILFKNFLLEPSRLVQHLWMKNGPRIVLLMKRKCDRSLKYSSQKHNTNKVAQRETCKTPCNENVCQFFFVISLLWAYINVFM